MLVIGYSLASLLGALLLYTPWASHRETSFVDAFFTATSAIAITGLTVVPTGQHWTMFGQGIILVLIQMGGLGIITIYTASMIMLKQRIYLSQRELVAEDRNHFDSASVVKLIKEVTKFTIAFQLAGAITLAIIFVYQLGFPLGKGIYFGVFYAISAFNNAGFELLGTSLAGLVDYKFLNGVIMFLAVIGALGFTVLAESRDYLVNKRKRLSLHAKLVLYVTGFLAFIGWGGFYLLEMNNTLAPLKLDTAFMAAAFQGIAAKTAGFNSLATEQFQPATLMFLMVLMFIGASPGSAAGGLKTTTIAVVVLALLASLRRNSEVVAFNKTIDPDSVNKAFAVTVIGSFFLIALIFLLLLTEDFTFLEICFEAVSALGTVGLSMGITSELSDIGKIIISAAMLLGRVGVVTFLIAFTLEDPIRLRRLEEKVLVG